MKTKTAAFNISIVMIRLALVLVFLIGVLICLIWYPITATIASGIGLLDADEVIVTPQMEFAFYSHLIFYWAVSVPCFVVALLGLWGTVQAKREGVFSIKVAKTLFRMALILFIASVVYIIGNVILLVPMFGGSQLVRNYFYVGGLGLAISVAFYAAHRFIVKRVNGQ